MEISNRFEVPAPPDEAWAFLLDVERVAPCMPGAELTEVVDETTWKGTVTVKLGPVSLTYKGKVVVAERDESARRLVLKATGTETRGKGTAQATVTGTLAAAGEGTAVDLVTDLTLSGAAAQYGRGMVADVSTRLTNEFADCVRDELTTTPAPATASGAESDAAAPAPAPARRPATPVAGLRLGLWSLWRAIVRGAKRLLSRR